MIIRRYGRLPVLFWSQLLALVFLVGCTFAPNLKTFAAMRCLTALFGTCPQVTGLYVVADMYPFHRQARMLEMDIRNRFHVQLIRYPRYRCFGRETMYDRGVKNLPLRPTGGLRYRIETLVGITGAKMAKYRATWYEAVSAPFKLVWRPHLLSILFFEVLILHDTKNALAVNQVTSSVFMATPKPLGYGFSQDGIAAMYATPLIAVIVGEIIGHFLNDAIMRITTRRNRGVFEAESRLWACYVAVPLYVCGFVVLGVALKEHKSVFALVMGWGLLVAAVMMNTVAVYAYTNDCFPKFQGEISALQNLARVLGGFSVAYFQVPWATKHGALQTLGCEAAIVAGLFILIVPTVQLTGRKLRGCTYLELESCYWIVLSASITFGDNRQVEITSWLGSDSQK
ncbi:hypothetical protein BGY98DRAFT_1173863 [Russula aff. rugulosa BPL654]|nr:hypothetical protein BGY98DRAFT_1173863 [Russula aff. rugulosa BPL654]